MARSQRLSKRKVSGTKYIKYRKKKQNELGGIPTMTKIAEVIKTKVNRVLGGNGKQRVLSSNIVNLKGKGGKYTKVKIKSAVENQANVHFVRRNILTKGAVIETEAGKAKITNRPGQEGTVNAVLVE